MFRDGASDLIVVKKVSFFCIGNSSRSLVTTLVDQSLLEDLELTGCHFETTL